MSDSNVRPDQTPTNLPPGYVHPAYTTPVSPQPVYAPPPPRGLSVSSLVIGIVSFFFGFTVILPIVGMVLGFTGLRREPAGRGMAIAGIWINGIILAFTVVTIAVILLAFLGIIGAVSIPIFGEIAQSGVAV